MYFFFPLFDFLYTHLSLSILFLQSIRQCWKSESETKELFEAAMPREKETGHGSFPVCTSSILYLGSMALTAD